MPKSDLRLSGDDRRAGRLCRVETCGNRPQLDNEGKPRKHGLCRSCREESSGLRTYGEDMVDLPWRAPREMVEAVKREAVREGVTASEWVRAVLAERLS